MDAPDVYKMLQLQDGSPSICLPKVGLLLFRLWLEFRPGETSDKHFPTWQNSQTVCSGLMKFLPGLVWLGNVYRDLTMFTESSAQCVAKGAFRSYFFENKNCNADD